MISRGLQMIRCNCSSARGGGGPLLYLHSSLEAPEFGGRVDTGGTEGLNLCEPQFHRLQKSVVGMALFRGFTEKNLFKAPT